MPETAALPPVQLVSRVAPFAERRLRMELPHGLTIAEMLQIAIPNPRMRGLATVELNGDIVFPEAYAISRPKPGQHVRVTIVPARSGGGGSKNVLAVVLSIAVIAVAAWVSGGAAAGVLGPAFGAKTFGAAVLGATIAIGGAIAVAALTAPPIPSLRSGDSEVRRRFTISGVRNELRPFSVVQTILGRHRVFPDLGAPPFTEIVGEDQWLRVVYDLGPGPLRLSDLRLGDTEFSNFQLDYEVRQAEVVDDPGKTNLSDDPLTLYTDDVDEQPFVPGIDLSAGVPTGRPATTVIVVDGRVTQHSSSPVGPWYTRTAGANADRLSIDLAWLKGLGKIDKGNKRERTATIRVQYAPTGTPQNGSWTEVGVFRFSDAMSVQPLLKNISWDVPTGDYDVRVRQEGDIGHGENPQEFVMTEASWVMLRTIRRKPPITVTGHTLLALRIKANDQSPVVDRFNCVAETIIPDFDVATGTWITRATRNPASLFRHVLQGPANRRPVPDSRIDLDALEEFHAWCVTNGFTFDSVLASERSVPDVLRSICSAGRARLTMSDTLKWSVAIERQETVPAAMFSPRNAWGVSVDLTWIPVPHALRILFLDEDADWQPGERIVFDDGFDENTATDYQELDLTGAVSNKEQAWKLGRFYLAALRLRSRRISFFTDALHLALVPGDLIVLTHDVILVGLPPHGARIKALVTSGGNTTGVVLDDLATIEAGQTYVLRVTLSSGVQQLHTLSTTPGETDTLQFATPVPTTGGPQVGDHVVFGAAGQESIELKVLAIRPGVDLTAEIIAVDHSPAVYTADSGPIPPFDSGITVPPELRRPPAPSIVGLSVDGPQTTKLAGGTVGARARLGVQVPSGAHLAGVMIEAQWRPSGAAVAWRAAGSVPAETREVVIEPLAPDTVVDIRIRTVRGTLQSAWVHVFGIVIPLDAATTFYDFAPVAGGYTATVSGKIPVFGPPRITGLRLVNSVTGHPLDTEFAGQDAAFTWNAVTMLTGEGDAEDDAGDDPEVEYLVEVWTDGVRRRQPEPVPTPGYTYTWAANLEDHLGRPQRTITLKVWARHKLTGAISDRPAELTASNPAPDMSDITPAATALLNAVLLDWSQFQPRDHDFSHYEIRRDTVSPPLTVYRNVAGSSRFTSTKEFVADLQHGTTYFLQVVPHDAFGAGVGSQIVSVVPEALPEQIGLFERNVAPAGIEFSVDDATNTISWTAGSISYLDSAGTPQTADVASGSAQWTAGTLYIVWVVGAAEFTVTGSLQAALGLDKVVMAVYRGGRQMLVSHGKVLQHGADILAGTIAAAALVADQAVITTAAQIAHALIGNAHITDLSATKLTAGDLTAAIILLTGALRTANSGARAELDAGGLRLYNASGAVIAHLDSLGAFRLGQLSGARVVMTENVIEVFDAVGVSVLRVQHTAPYLRIGREGGAVAPLKLTSLGDLEQIVTNQILNLAVGASGIGSGANSTNWGLGVGNTERVLLTFSNLVRTIRSSDVILTWIRYIFRLTDPSGNGASGTVRVRRGGASGTVLHQASMSLAGSKTPPVTASRLVVDFLIQAPNAPDAVHSFVVTAQKTSGTTTNVTIELDSFDIMVLRKSA